MKVDTRSSQGGQSCYKDLKSGSQVAGYSPSVSCGEFVELLIYVFSVVFLF